MQRKPLYDHSGLIPLMRTACTRDGFNTFVCHFGHFMYEGRGGSVHAQLYELAVALLTENDAEALNSAMGWVNAVYSC